MFQEVLADRQLRRVLLVPRVRWHLLALWVRWALSLQSAQLALLVLLVPPVLGGLQSLPIRWKWPGRAVLLVRQVPPVLLRQLVLLDLLRPLRRSVRVHPPVRLRLLVRLVRLHLLVRRVRLRPLVLRVPTAPWLRVRRPVRPVRQVLRVQRRQVHHLLRRRQRQPSQPRCPGSTAGRE